MNESPEEDEGIEVDLPQESSDIEELPDGGAMVTLEETSSTTSEFGDNLAKTLPVSVLHAIGEELLELLERDQESWKLRGDAYEEGLRRSGLDRESSVGADFDGASRAVHPILAEAAVDFAARAIKELFPPNGPVKTQIIGKVDDAKLDKADRKKTYLNWQLTKRMPEYRPELEQLLTQISLAGSQFSKTYYDPTDKRTHFEYVPSDKIILPFSATSFMTAKRKAQILELTQMTFESRVDSGMYEASDSSAPYGEIDQTKVQEEANRIEGKEQSGYNEDGLRTAFEVYVWWPLDEDDLTDGEPAPYIITVDEYTRKVVGFYRNWEEEDKQRKEVQWITEWPFIPWRGALTVGLVHLIGSLAIAATGSLNALLDSAHVNNTPTAVALKGSKVTGATAQIEPTTVHQLEGPAGMDDIRKLMMPMPYNPPSAVLFQLLGWLTDAAKGVVTTASEKLADASNTGPVGTTYALIEEGAKVFSSIHARLHAAQAQVLDIICRLNSKYLNDKEVVEELGELVVSRQDFMGPQDICPISDPNIFSETQRWAQIQETFKLSQDPRVKYDVYKIHERALQLLKVPQIDEILPKPTEPTQTNPVAENVNASKGLPLFVFPEEDHVAHLKVHLSFVTDQAFQMISTQAIAPIFAHVQQHMAYLYAHVATTLASGAVGKDITQYMLDTKLANHVDGLLAEAIGEVHDLYAQQVQPFQQQLMQLAQAAQQQAQAQAQNAPPDPASQVAREVGMAEIQRKTQADQATQQMKGQELQQKAKDAQDKTQLTLVSSQQKIKADQEKSMAELTAKNQLEIMKAHLSAEMEQMKLEQKSNMDLMLAHLDNILKIELAELSAKTTFVQSQIDAAQQAELAATQQAEGESAQ